MEFTGGVPHSSVPVVPGQEPVGGMYKYRIPNGPPVVPK